jgi:hypothetical protein
MCFLASLHGHQACINELVKFFYCVFAAQLLLRSDALEVDWTNSLIFIQLLQRCFLAHALLCLQQSIACKLHEHIKLLSIN